MNGAAALVRSVRRLHLPGVHQPQIACQAFKSSNVGEWRPASVVVTNLERSQPHLELGCDTEVVPDQYVVISGGHGGALALRVRGEDVGSVWWVDYDVADEEDIYEPSERVMRRLADDFDGFLALF